MADPEGHGLLPVTPQSLDQFKAHWPLASAVLRGCV
jgi:hypothetical protein